MADTDWSAYGACDTCGCVPGWACHRGKRQLKNAHPGRPRTGQEPYVAPDQLGKFPTPVAELYPGGPVVRIEETTKETTMAMDPAAEAVDWTARLDNADRLPSNPTGKRKVDAEVPRDIDRDQYDRPKLVRAEHQPDGSWRVPFYPPGPEVHAGCPIIELEGFTRASTLGNALEDSTGLNVWRGGMVVFGMSRRKDLVLAAQAIPGTEDKKLHRRPLYEIADKAKEAAEASSAATVGTALHALTEQADRGQLTVDIGEYQAVLDIYLERMTDWKVVRSETFVVSDHFHAAGSFDRLITPLEPMALVDQHTGEIITVIMPGDLVVVDLKTSTTADYFGAKFFAQLAVYVTGQEYDRDPESPTYGARTPLGQRTDFALILHIPQGGDADGEPLADWHWLDMRAGLALAQLACVVLETRKKRFTRTHMRPVLAQPVSPNLAAEEPRSGVTTSPVGIPARDPLGDEHLAVVSGFVAESESFPAAEADLVDAELAEDGRMPEGRRPAPAALATTNAGADPRTEHEKMYDDEEAGGVPGPEETAPLPAGWESRAEQDMAKEATTAVPKGLGAHLQDAAERHKVEAALIRAIGRATSVRGPGGLTDLYERASKAGYWSDRVKAAASARRKELEA